MFGHHWIIDEFVAAERRQRYMAEADQARLVKQIPCSLTTIGKVLFLLGWLRQPSGSLLGLGQLFGIHPHSVHNDEGGPFHPWNVIPNSADKCPDLDFARTGRKDIHIW
jgi:hypothetical protein